jgi:transmembrane sensor
VALALAAVVALVVLREPGGPDLVAEAEDVAVTHTAADGSTVRLRPHSRLHRLPAPDGRLRYRLNGEAYFDVVQDPARTFEVEAGRGLVQVLGTRFTVQTWSGAAEVFLETGRVAFSTLAPPPEADSARLRVTLAPGQRSRVTPGGALTPPAPASARAALDWLDGEMHFARTPARRVADELAHHYGLTLRLPPDVRTQTLSGRVVLDDRAQSLRDLGTVLGGRFERTGPDTYRFVPAP